MKAKITIVTIFLNIICLGLFAQIIVIALVNVRRRLSTGGLLIFQKRIVQVR